MKNNEIRERLVELLIEADKFNKEICDSFGPCGVCPYAQYRECAERVFADYFVAHGVTFAETDGCGYCDVAKAYNDFPFINKNAEVDKWTMMGKKLKYCPMCGRQLPEPPKEEP